MKTKATLSILASAALLAVAAPAWAHGDVHRDRGYTVHYDVHHDYRVRDRHRMPRWMRRHDGFRHWYSHSRYQRDRQIAWNTLWDIYVWERRYDRRYDQRYDNRYDRRYDYRVDVYRDDRRRQRGKSKHRH